MDALTKTDPVLAPRNAFTAGSLGRSDWSQGDPGGDPTFPSGVRNYRRNLYYQLTTYLIRAMRRRRQLPQIEVEESILCVAARKRALAINGRGVKPSTW
ncbi:hypothetical protein FHL15_004140 [Xylaria flabelliformis]|uniref:Uncharacterized protein n=1 Tax=Xylaria flabelliformis TaxID=2512241 RepID=A0A553I4B5_9PEZI|nr:hypothetical protein FHL15_004140 [Xylaria flabelliformis]